MNILIDTNIFIPLETSPPNNPEPQVHLINEFYRKAKELSYHVFLIDVQKKDINNDKNEERKKQRLLAFEKYEILENIKLTDAIYKAFPMILLIFHY